MPQEPSLAQCWEPLPVCMEEEEFSGPQWTGGIKQALPCSTPQEQVDDVEMFYFPQEI